MGRRIPNSGPIPDGVRRRLEPLAAQHGVSVNRIVEVVRARRDFRRAEFFRRRSRKRVMAKNPYARRMKMLEGEAQYAGEGELHALLRVIDMKPAEFCAIVGLNISTFNRWYGHPLHPWPVEFLRYYGWARAMAQYLRDENIDPEQFKPKIPERAMPTGRYPRTPEQQPKIANQEDYSPWKPGPK
jgi:hypothetical protein